MFLTRNKKNNVYPCKPQFYYIKMGFRGSKLYRNVFVMRSDKDADKVRVYRYYMSPVSQGSSEKVNNTLHSHFALNNW